MQAQQPAVEVTLLGIQFDTERIKRLFALLLLLFLKLLQALHDPDGKPGQGYQPPRGGCQPAVRQRLQPVIIV